MAHDLDHFQLEQITDDEMSLEMNGVDIALTDYGRRNRLNCGCIFFKKSCLSI